MDKKSQTIDTYNRSAKQLADKFDSLGTYAADIGEVFDLVKKINPKVLEIGCANGRDALEILRHTNDYLGVDASGSLIQIAQQRIPQGKFEVADVESFELPEQIDIIFAFASLIHVDRTALSVLMEKMHKALSPSGVVFFTMKYADKYQEVTKEDEFGVRTYYHYSDKDIADLAKNFSIIKNEIYDLRGQKWIKTLLKK